MSGWGAPIRRRPGAAARSRGPRPAGSFESAVERARTIYDELTGGLADGAVYPPDAARCIVELALALWADTAAVLESGEFSEV